MFIYGKNYTVERIVKIFKYIKYFSVVLSDVEIKPRATLLVDGSRQLATASGIEGFKVEVKDKSTVGRRLVS